MAALLPAGGGAWRGGGSAENGRRGPEAVGRVDERLRDHAWFMAYAPSDHPKIALAVLVENGGFGAQAAAPIARKVIDRYVLGSTEPGAAQVVAPGGDDESD